MKTYYECIPCFINQILRALNSIDAIHHEPILREVLHLLEDIDFSLSPPELARKGFDIIERLLRRRKEKIQPVYIGYI